MRTDPFTVLGLPGNATKDEVKKQFHKLAHIYHPDKGGDTKKFQEISAAYHDASKIAPEQRVTATEGTAFGFNVRVTYTTRPVYRWNNPPRTSEHIIRKQKELEEMMQRMQEDIARSRAEILRRYYNGNTTA